MPKLLSFLLLFLAATLVAQNPTGALSGREIVISPGHGYYWHPTLGWTTQRPLIDELIEDRHNHEIIHDHLLPWLEGTGADVLMCRAYSRTREEHLLQNDALAPTYTESGTWTTSVSSGFGNTGYRFAPSDPLGSSRARFRTTITQSDHYPVYVAWRASSNRLPQVEVEIHHAGGMSLRTVNQQLSDRRLVYVGTFPFRAFEVAEVVITSRGPSGFVVIADAVKIGDGMGSIVRGGTSSGQPRWLEASRYHAELFGAPSSVYDSSTSGDNTDDVTCRPRYGEWFTEGRGDLYLSLHTNAGGGTGTDTFIYNGGATAGSQSWQQILHTTLIQALRRDWDPAWVDRGMKQANFGELRLLSSMPGCLVELAFHDDLGGDIEAIHHPEFRAISGRAMADAIVSFLAPGSPPLLAPPLAVMARNLGQGRIAASFSPVPTATGYRLQVSTDGFGWDDGRDLTGTSFEVTGLLPGEQRYFRVAARNATGRGLWSEPFGARVTPYGLSPLVIVNGFDRRDRRHKEAQNPRNGLVQLGALVAAIARVDLPFDSASNEAVANGLLDLNAYQSCYWSLGAESTVDESFSTTEQARISVYLTGGGRLLFSGSEVGFDLDARGSIADRAFYNQILDQTYLADDAQSYATLPITAGPLSPLPSLTISDGSDGGYDVAFPDVVGPRASGGQVVLRYAHSLSAGALSANGRVLGLGFPLERVLPPADAVQLLERALRLMAPSSLEATAEAPAARIRLDLHFADEGGASYFAFAALSTSPAIAIPGGGALPLAFDPLLLLSQDPVLQAIFEGFQGTLDASGRAMARLNVPTGAGLTGIELALSAAIFDPQSGILRDIAPAVRITLP